MREHPLFQKKIQGIAEKACWRDGEGTCPMEPWSGNLLPLWYSVEAGTWRIMIVEEGCQIHGREESFWKLAIHSWGCFRYTVDGIGVRSPASLRPGRSSHSSCPEGKDERNEFSGLITKGLTSRRWGITTELSLGAKVLEITMVTVEKNNGRYDERDPTGCEIIWRSGVEKTTEAEDERRTEHEEEERKGGWRRTTGGWRRTKGEWRMLASAPVVWEL
jgi:hypothetical protein